MNRIMYFFVLCTLVLSLSVFGQESSTTPAVRQIEQPPPQFSFKDVASIAIPQRMTYQGVLTGPGGAPVTDGAYNITIELFDVSSGSAAVWTDNTFTLPVERGAFTVILGSSVPLNIVFDKTYWLQVTVTGGPALPPPATYPETLLPRTELTAAPYSLAPWSPAASNIYYNTGNVGIGTSNPTEKLEVSGNIKASKVLAGAYSSNSPWIAEAPSGMTRMYIDDVSGAVGIGTTSPGAYSLAVSNANASGHVVIRANVANTTGQAALVFTANGDASSRWEWGRSGSSNGDPGNLYLHSGSYGRVLTGTPAGNIGIGTTSPTQKLDVNGIINATDFYKGGVPFGGSSQWTTSGSDIYYNTGKVGIGVSNPGAPLHVRVNHAGGGPIVRVDNVNSTGDVPIDFEQNGTLVGNVGYIPSASPTGGPSRMFVLQNGTAPILSLAENGANVGIGTASPAQLLELSGGNLSLGRLNSSTYSRYIGIGGFDGSIAEGGSGGAQIKFTSSSSNDNTIQFLTHHNGVDHSVHMTIDREGNVGVGTATPLANTGNGSLRNSIETLGWIVSKGNGSNTWGDPSTRIGVYAPGGSDNDGAWYFSGNPDHHFAIHQGGGGDRLNIDNSGNVCIGIKQGPVGIGINQPNMPLWVGGSPIIEGANRSLITAGDHSSLAAGTGGGIAFAGVYTSADAEVGWAGISGIKENSTDGDWAASLVFNTRPTGLSMAERMRVTSTGNVGIGTASPADKFHIYESRNGRLYSLLQNPNTGSSAVSELRIGEDVGDNTKYLTLGYHNSGYTPTGYENPNQANVVAAVGATNGLVLATNGSAPLKLITNLTERMRVAANGNVGIGTTNPQGALDVSSTTGAFIVPRMTTTQRDALTAVNGMIIYNTTDNQFNFYENGAWVTK